MAPPEKPAKTMSSRLMNMKFMQRASASSPSSTPDRGSQRPPKRQKLANESPASPSDAASLPSEHSTPKLNAEAERFLERQAELAGETKWTLPFEITAPPSHVPGLHVVRVGFNEIDSPSGNDDEDGSDADDSHASPRPENMGRRQFGSFKNQAKDAKEAKPASDEDEDSSSESSEGVGSTPGSATAGKKRGRAASESDKTASKKRKSGDDVDLRKLTSISNAGAPPPSSPSMTCYLCGQKGHMQSACRIAKKKRGKGPWRGGHGKS